MLLDTSGLMCLFDKGDARHLKATEQYQAATSRFIHNYVLAEFVALAIARRAPRQKALGFLAALVRSDEIEKLWVDRGLHERAMQMLINRIDKAWSLCDAVSFAMMLERNDSNALTTDHDFEQAGFVRMLDR